MLKFEITKNVATCGLGHEIVAVTKEEEEYGNGNVSSSYTVNTKKEETNPFPSIIEDGRGFLVGTDFYIVDIRDMLKDEDGEPLETYIKTIDYAMHCLNTHKKIVIGCSAGQSRSPAIAMGVLMKRYHMDFYTAYNLVRDKVPIANIAPCHITALKSLFNVGLP